MKFTTLGFLTFVLWTTFVLSLLAIPYDAIFAAENERAERYRFREGSAMGTASQDKLEEIQFKQMARIVNPTRHFYTLVLSAGFLAIMRTQRLVGSILLDAIRSSPDATAEALRRAVKAKGP